MKKCSRLCLFNCLLIFFFLLSSCEEQSPTYDAQSPGEVLELNAFIGDGQITITWKNPSDSDFDHVEIYYGIGSPDNQFTGKIDPAGTLFQGLDRDKEYHFLILTVDKTGNRSVGKKMKVIPDKTPTGEVSNFTISPYNGYVVLSWSNPLDSDFSHVLITYSSQGNPQIEIEGAVEAESQVIGGLTNGLEYTFTIKTIDRAGNRSEGLTKIATPDAAILDVTPPGEVTGLTAVPGDKQVTLSWTNPADSDFDRVKISFGRGSASTVFTGTADPQGTLLGNLTNAYEYTFLVQTIDENGNISSGETRTTTPNNVAPLTADWETDMDNPFSITLEGFSPFWYAGAQFIWNVVTGEPVDSCTWYLDGLEQGTGLGCPFGPLKTSEEGEHTLVLEIRAQGALLSEEYQFILKTAGERGPAGGFIFYDKGEYSDGWRYLEAAPADLVREVEGETVDSAIWGPWYSLDDIKKAWVIYTETGIGTGKANTEYIFTQHERYSGYPSYNPDYAAKLSRAYEAGGYDDWFLPSKDELNMLYGALCNTGIDSSLYPGPFWSSSEVNTESAWSQSFQIGLQNRDPYKIQKFHIRTIRAF